MLEGDDETPIARRNFLKGASVAGAAMLTPTLAGAGATVPTPDQQPSLVNPEPNRPMFSAIVPVKSSNGQNGEQVPIVAHFGKARAESAVVRWLRPPLRGDASEPGAAPSFEMRLS